MMMPQKTSESLEHQHFLLEYVMDVLFISGKKPVNVHFAAKGKKKLEVPSSDNLFSSSSIKKNVHTLYKEAIHNREQLTCWVIG